MSVVLERKYTYYITFTVLSVDLDESFGPVSHPSDAIQVRFGNDSMMIPQANSIEGGTVKIEDYQGDSDDEPSTSRRSTLRFTERMVTDAMTSTNSHRASSQSESDAAEYIPPKPFGVKKWRIFNSPNKMIERFTKYFFYYDLLRKGERIALASQWVTTIFIEKFRQPDFVADETLLDLDLFLPKGQVKVGTLRVHTKIKRNLHEDELHHKMLHSIKIMEPRDIVAE